MHESGFTYDPADFMKANIFFYNFAWKDFGEASMVGLLDMVKVLSFALSEGKVAVHCHAGLGRTGKKKKFLGGVAFSCKGHTPFLN